MKRFAMILVTLGALATTACGGAMPDGVDEEGRQLAPLWMAERDLPGCDGVALATASQATLLSHPFDKKLVIAVSDGAPSCIDTVGNILGALRTWQPSGQPVMAAMVAPWDAPLPFNGEEEEQETKGTEKPRDDSVAIPNLNETISDDPVPIKDDKPVPTAENDPDAK
jgi:hypothetical protein